MTDDDIEQTFKFSTPTEIESRNGTRYLRTASPTPAKLAFFYANRLELASRGVVYRAKFKGREGEMEFAWWMERPEVVQILADRSFEASRSAESSMAVPMGSNITLRPYQAAGVEYMHTRKAFLLADEMGLGKTLQIVGVMNIRKNLQRILVICPHKVRTVWWKEFNRGLTQKRSIAFADQGIWPTSDIVIVHYDVAYKYEAQMSNFMWDMVIIDEAHYLRNRGTRRTRSILGARADNKKNLPACSGIPARVKAILTGTPLANEPMDLFPYLRWADKEYWGTYTDFEQRYAFDPRSHAELHRRLREWGMLRRKKIDVAKDLPPKTRTMIVIDAHTAAQREVVARDQRLLSGHEKELNTAMSEDAFMDDIEGNVLKALKIPMTEMSAMRKATAEALYPDAVEQIREILEQKDKLVVFVHHRDILLRLVQDFRDMGAVHCIGGMSSAQLEQNIRIFRNDGRCRLFVASIIAAGTGVDGLQEACSTCLFIEDDWLSVQVDQAEDRLHRIGQHSPVDCYHMALAGSVGIRILQVSMGKRQLASRIIDGSDEPVRSTEPDAFEAPMRTKRMPSIFGKSKKVQQLNLPKLFR